MECFAAGETMSVAACPRGRIRIAPFWRTRLTVEEEIFPFVHGLSMVLRSRRGVFLSFFFFLGFSIFYSPSNWEGLRSSVTCKGVDSRLSMKHGSKALESLL